MLRFKSLTVLVWLIVALQPSFADDREKVLGLWRVLSFETEYHGSSERDTPLGKDPTGYLMYTPEGRMWCIAVSDEGEAPKTDERSGGIVRVDVRLYGHAPC